MFSAIVLFIVSFLAMENNATKLYIIENERSCSKCIESLCSLKTNDIAGSNIQIFYFNAQAESNFQNQLALRRYQYKYPCLNTVKSTDSIPKDIDIIESKRTVYILILSDKVYQSDKFEDIITIIDNN